MPTKEEVFHVADQLRAAKERVSLRRLRTELKVKTGQGGSYRTIGPWLAEWKAKFRYQPGIELAPNLPEPLQKVLLSFGKQAWDEACNQATAVFNGERVLLEEREAVADQALAAADALEAQVRALTAEVAALREQMAEPPRIVRVWLSGRAGDERLRGEELRERNEYWDRVMQEVAALMRSRVFPMTTEEIAQGLPEAVRREAEARGRPLTPRLLGRKMKTRAQHERYFLDLRGGRFQLRA